MDKNIRKLGFIYFENPKYVVKKQVDTWLPALKRLGASYVIFKAGFRYNISEDVFICAEEHGLEPIVHFKSELPIARKFNDVALIMDAYAKWGVRHILLGDKPNTKAAWRDAGWHYENLADHFLDRFIPLANHMIRIGINPVLPPMQPGGDYWDTAFLELVAKGLKRRKLDGVLEELVLASYGYTFGKPLSWGKGGPERWSASKPYSTPEGQEDQLGFHNYAWTQAHVQRQLGRELPVMIMDAGSPGGKSGSQDQSQVLADMKAISRGLRDGSAPDDEGMEGLDVNDDMLFGCFYSLDTISSLLNEPMSYSSLESSIFSSPKSHQHTAPGGKQTKNIPRYLLLPSYQAGVSDALLNKVRPIIKKFKPTVGFSLDEASMAQRVMIYPDPHVFTDEQIKGLRAAGCAVEILPESGIEIATFLQE